MGRDRIRYYVVRHGRGYWQPNKAMREAGFRLVRCGADGPEARRIAMEWSSRWDAHRKGGEQGARIVPGSLQEAFTRYKRTAEWAGRAASTKAEWEAAWRRIGPVFGPMPPADVTMELIDAFKVALQEIETHDTVWRCIKVWRALWGVAAAMNLTGGKPDPSLKVTRGQAARRSQTWTEGEIVRLVKAAWRGKGRGLACIIAVAWDSQLSPGDVRALTPAHRVEPRRFDTARGKTDNPALGTITRRTQRLVDAYLAEIGTVLPTAPLFRGADGRAYGSKQALSKAFARLRARVFGEHDDRTLMDIRRSGAVEALVGGVDPGHLGAKMANSIADARDLQRTYQPVDPAAVRAADEARLRGRKKMRDGGKA